MKRTAGTLVLLAALGGCVGPRPDPEFYDLTGPARLPPGAAARGPGWPQGQGQSGAPGPNGCGSVFQAAREPGNEPAPGSATTIAGLASAPAPAALTEHTAGRLAAPPAEMPPAPAAVSPVPTPPERSDFVAAGRPGMVVNTRRILLNYEVKDNGSSGPASLELWYTHNGGPWQKYQGAPPGERRGVSPPVPPFVVDVEEEGRYGFTLLAHNSAGRGKAPPQAGDAPQVTVEVDLTQPRVHLASVQPEADGKAVTILWGASDKNLGPQPIALLWARDAAGPWLPIVTQQENFGRYLWKLPDGLPANVFVRVEATDQAGNVGTDQTSTAVALQRAEPSAAIVAVQAGDSSPPPTVASVQAAPAPTLPAASLALAGGGAPAPAACGRGDPAPPAPLPPAPVPVTPPASEERPAARVTGLTLELAN